MTNEVATFTLDASKDISRLEVKPGDTIVIDLEENVSTGYSWALDDVPQPLMRVTEDSQTGGPGGRMGSPGHRRIAISAIGPGEAEIRAFLRRPWEKDQPPAQTFTVRVVVR